MARFKKLEIELCECGHDAPLDYLIYDKEGCSICMKCYSDYLTELLRAEKKKNRKLRAEIKSVNKYQI